MKAPELRIGNWVLTNNGVKPITTLETHDCSTLVSGCERAIVWRRYSEIKPVELTEEWLVNFGFVKTVANGEDWLAKYDGSEWFLTYHIKDNLIYAMAFPMVHVKYVHQLQNLYFALTGEELEVKGE